MDKTTQKKGTSKAKIKLNSIETFEGRAAHKDILAHLLTEIQPVNFRELIGLPTEEAPKQKHIIFAVIKHLLETASRRNWNLCTAFGGNIYIYNGAYWKQCEKADVRNFLCEAAVKMGHPDYEVKADTFPDKLLKQFLTDGHLPTKEADTEKILINLQSGTFEFTNESWKQREFNTDDFLTYQLQFDYNADATCPMFDKFLMRVLPDEDCRKTVQEFAGFIFTTLNLEKCLFLLGEGGNGKSVFMNVLSALIGAENILKYSLGLFNHEYNRAKLVNVLVNYSSEKGTDLNPDTFKALVSMEAVQAREIYQKPFTLYNRAKFVINGNTLPKETENTEAYFRRYLIVPFDVKITEAEKDIDLAKKIIATELPGVFNWMLKGLERILQKRKFTQSEKTKQALEDFKRQSDSVQLFIDETRYIQSDKHKETILRLRNETDTKKQKQLKDKLPYYTVAGIFSHRCNEGLVQPSGLAAVDLDSAEDYDVLDLLQQMKVNPFIAYAGLSCRGQRIFCIVPFKYPAQYVKHYERLVQSFIDWGLPMGDDCHKKISQPRFVSWNDESTQFFNHDAKPYSLLPAERTIYTIPRQKRNTAATPASSPFEIAARILEKQGNYFQDGNKHNYIFGFCSWVNKMGVPQPETEQYIHNHLLPLSEIKSNCIEFPYKHYSAEFETFDFDRDKDRRYSPKINMPQTQQKFTTINKKQPEAAKPHIEQIIVKNKRCEIPPQDDWSKDITDIEHYFETETMPAAPVILNPYSAITNVSLFIESHFATVKHNNGKQTFLPYLERLQVLKRINLHKLK